MLTGAAPTKAFTDSRPNHLCHASCGPKKLLMLHT